MNRQQQDTFNALKRERDTNGVLDLLGKDYDFTTDTAGVVEAATWYGDIELLRHALDNGGTVSKEGKNGYPLGIAATSGELKFVTLLLERGAPLDSKDKYGRTALVRASGNGKLPVVRALLKAGANPTGALYAAANVASAQVVKALIEAGALLDEVSTDGAELTPLLVACSTGKKKGSAVALMLLKAGANAAYVRASDGMSAMHFALWGQCSTELLAELQARGAPTPEAEFAVIKLVKERP